LLSKENKQKKKGRKKNPVSILKMHFLFLFFCFFSSSFCCLRAGNVELQLNSCKKNVLS